MLLLVLAAACLGTGPTFGKLAYAGGFDPITLITVRLAISVAGIWIVTPALSQAPVTRMPPIRLLAPAVLMQMVNFFGFFFGLQLLDAATATLVFWSYPIFVTLPALLRRQVPAAPTILRALLMAAGIILVVGPTRGEASLLGLGLILTSAVSVAAQLPVLERLVSEVDSVIATRALLTGVLLCCMVVWSVVQPPLRAIAGEGWLAVLGLALVTTVAARILLFAGIRRAGRLEAALTGSAEPVFALILIVLVLREPLIAAQIVGAILVFASIGLSVLLQTRSAQSD